MKRKVIFAILCLLPLLMACEKSDDVTDIFVGKAWRLNYIASGNIGSGWYAFDDVTKANMQEYGDRTKTFKLSLSGLQQDKTISGIFNGSGSLSVSGKWTAIGDNRSFTTSDVSGTPTDDKDIIAQKILYGLTNATSYKGDINNLYIYFSYKGTNLFMAFSPYNNN